MIVEKLYQRLPDILISLSTFTSSFDTDIPRNIQFHYTAIHLPSQTQF